MTAAPASSRAYSNQFRYVIRGHKGDQAAGSVPFQIFQAEPDSALAVACGGEWAQAVDEEGRAIVNSNPSHWPLILDWLSFGAVPDNPSSGFIAECRYWQLDRLLHAMEMKQDFGDAPARRRMSTGDGDLTINRVEKASGAIGLLLKGRVHQFAERIEAGKEVKIYFIAFRRQFYLLCDRHGICITRMSGPHINITSMQVSIASSPQHVEHWPSEKSMEAGFRMDGDIHEVVRWGIPWTQADLDKLSHPALMDADGSVLLKVEAMLG